MSRRCFTQQLLHDWSICSSSGKTFWSLRRANEAKLQGSSSSRPGPQLVSQALLASRNWHHDLVYQGHKVPCQLIAGNLTFPSTCTPSATCASREQSPRHPGISNIISYRSVIYHPCRPTSTNPQPARWLRDPTTTTMTSTDPQITDHDLHHHCGRDGRAFTLAHHQTHGFRGLSNYNEKA